MQIIESTEKKQKKSKNIWLFILLLLLGIILGITITIILLSDSNNENGLINKLEKVLKELEEDVLKMNNVVGNYSLLGINEFSSSSIKYLVSIECKANCQYQIKRDYFKLIKNAFDKNNINIPYNKLDINVRGKDE